MAAMMLIRLATTVWRLRPGAGRGSGSRSRPL
jgi:hypothetical protein